MKQIKFAVALLLPILLIGLQFSTAYAADFAFTVNDSGDGSDVSVGDNLCDAGGGDCTLRAAIEEANNLPSNSIDINFSGVTQVNTGSELLFFPSTALRTINGAGVTVENTGTGRVLAIDHAELTINGLTITGGDDSDGYGAGIYIYGGAVTLQNGVLVTLNDAGTNWGGGVYLEVDTGAVLIVDNSTISENNADYGGGIFIDDGTSAILQNGAVVTQNSTRLAGAGIFAFGSLTITDSAVTYNSGNSQGQGIYYAQFVNVPSISVTNSCIVCNGDNAVSGPAGISADFSSNWWGTAAGPYYSLDTQGLQCSTGDSISIDAPLSDRNISVATSGTCTGGLATGNWLVEPTAGCTGNEIQPASSIGRARTCTPP